MSFFSILLSKLIPFYLNILLGFIAGKWLQTPRDAIARMMFYMINPIILFNGVLHTKLDASVMTLPVLVFTISCSMCLAFYSAGKRFWDDSTKNLLAFSAGSGNSGFFGLPLALIFFDSQGEGIYMMGFLGMLLYDVTLGFYFLARGQYTSRECLVKLAQQPVIYAFLIALTLNLLQAPIPELFLNFMCHMKGAYTVMGMMIVGLGLASLKRFEVDFKLIGMTFTAKFIVWPLIMLGIIALDRAFFGFYNEQIYQALILLSVVPLAVNLVVLATVFNTHPEKASTAVMISILFALVYVPLMLIYFIPVTSGMEFCPL